MVGVPSLAPDVASSYRIALTRSGEGADSAWLAEIEGLPGGSGKGATPEEAVQNAWAAANGRRAEAKGGSSSAPAPTRHSGRLLVRMPGSLHDELAKTAEREGVSLNQLITSALASAVGWRRADRSTEGPGETLPGDRDAARPATESRWPQARVTRMVLAVNFALVLVAAIAAIALLVVAWNGV
jgi:antitoxin HicB